MKIEKLSKPTRLKKSEEEQNPFLINISGEKYICTAWKRFDEYCFSSSSSGKYPEIWRKNLADHGGKVVYISGSSFVEFKSESHYTLFLIKWS